MIDDKKSFFVQTQGSLDFCWFQLIVWIRSWGLTYLTTSSLRQDSSWAYFSTSVSYEPETAKKLLEESLEKVTFWHFEEINNLIQVDTREYEPDDFQLQLLWLLTVLDGNLDPWIWIGPTDHTQAHAFGYLCWFDSRCTHEHRHCLHCC